MAGWQQSFSKTSSDVEIEIDGGTSKTRGVISSEFRGEIGCEIGGEIGGESETRG